MPEAGKRLGRWTKLAERGRFEFGGQIVTITRATLEALVANFHGELPVTARASCDAAIGWLEALEVRGDELWGFVKPAELPGERISIAWVHDPNPEGGDATLLYGFPTDDPWPERKR